jgi:hypothetical protein
LNQAGWGAGRGPVGRTGCGDSSPDSQLRTAPIGQRKLLPISEFGDIFHLQSEWLLIIPAARN